MRVTPLALAYRRALHFTGKVVVLVGVTLAAGVATWALSPIKLQADRGAGLHVRAEDAGRGAADCDAVAVVAQGGEGLKKAQLTGGRWCVNGAAQVLTVAATRRRW